MEIIKKPLGLYKTNCYILKEGNEAVIIDPGFHGRQIVELLAKANPLAILLTHGHCDHICAVDYLYKIYGMPIYMNKKDDILLHTKRRMPSAYKGHFTSPYNDLTAGIISFGPFSFKVHETPGHSEGSVFLEIGAHLFTGDTLFKNNIGNTNTFNGDAEAMQKTLTYIKTLSPHLSIYPGHAENSDLKVEFENNPWLQNRGE